MNYKEYDAYKTNYPETYNYNYCEKCNCKLDSNSICVLCDDCKQNTLSLIDSYNRIYIDELIILFDFNFKTFENFKYIIPVWELYINIIESYELNQLEILQLKESVITALKDKKILHYFDNNEIINYLKKLTNE